MNTSKQRTEEIVRRAAAQRAARAKNRRAWLLAVTAGCLLLAVAAYLVLRKHDMFTRYEADGTWRGPAATVVKWLLRFDIAFFVLTGVAAIVSWFVVYHR